MSSTDFDIDITDWVPNERSSTDLRILGPGDIIWAKVSVPFTVVQAIKRRTQYPDCATRKEAIEMGSMQVVTSSSRKRRSGGSARTPEPPKKSSTMDSDPPDQTSKTRPGLILFTCMRDSELGYVSAPLTRLDGRTPEETDLSAMEGFYEMIYPVSLSARFEIPAGRNGGAWLQKLLPIPGWETKDHNQYCALGALVKVDSKHAKTDRNGLVHRLPADLLRQAQREAMGLMNPLERSRLHIGQPDFVDRIMRFDPLPWGPPYTYNLPPTVTEANAPGRGQSRN